MLFGRLLGLALSYTYNLAINSRLGLKYFIMLRPLFTDKNIF